jgi:diadenosine tetraphosphate (Ap4A) HIT family hydrolase
MSGLSTHSFVQKGCIFCDGTHHKILFSDENFVVALDNFPLTEGHLLIFSKNHYGCAGEVPQEMLSSLVQIKNTVLDLLYAQYKKAIFYEHGRAGGCVSFGPDERLCHHFHLHALPVACDVSSIIKKQVPQHIRMNSFGDINDLFARYGEYLYFENNDRVATMYPVSGKIPPHFLRTLIANALDAPQLADWENIKDQNFIEMAIHNAYAKLKF